MFFLFNVMLIILNGEYFFIYFVITGIPQISGVNDINID